MEVIDGLSSETIVQLSHKYKTTDYRLLWHKAQRDYKDHFKDHKLKAVTWNHIRKSVELPGLRQIIHAFSTADWVHM